MERVTEYRVTMFGDPMGPWRRDRRQARRDAIELDLGSYTEWGAFYITVPGDIERRKVCIEAEIPQAVAA